MDKKNKLVVKHNDLIETRYDLNLQEQKIILYAVSQIDKDADKFNKVKIYLPELSEMIGANTVRYTDFRILANNLMDRRIYFKDRPNLDVRWLASSEYIGEGYIELEFSEKLLPYLIQLKNRFTRYELKNILYLNVSYAIRFFELLKQYEAVGKRMMTIGEIRDYFDLKGQYSSNYDLHRYVIQPAIDDINDKTDIKITFTKIKKGRTVTGYEFKIAPKDSEKNVYIEFLNQVYNIADLKRDMGLSSEKLSAEQIATIYEVAVRKTQDRFHPYEYVKLNYYHVKEKNSARSIYSYLLKALEEDYAAACGQLRLFDIASESL